MRRWRTEASCRLSRRAAIGLVLGAAMLGRGVGRAEPAAVGRGFSQAGLQRLGDYFRNEVAAGRIPGAVVLVQQHGEPVFSQSFGLRDVTSGAPMTADTIFRLYSMSKPITSAAAMMLVDDGRLGLDDPVANYIPAFAGVKVGAERRGDDGQTVQANEPPDRAITILDLLRHTSGITYGFYGDTPVRRRYAHSGLFDGDVDNATFVARLARLPLAEQPGTRWDYGHSTDVLGRIIEVISGQSLFDFEKQRLLDPLGMTETAFFLADPAQRPRIAEPLPGDRFAGPIAGIVDPVLPRSWQSGGAGMIGTIGDYARFVQMLLDRGTVGGRRYLAPATVALMTEDHLGSGILRDELYFPGPDSGFGLGFAVRTRASPPLPEGEVRWDGVGGTFFFIDPRDDMFAIVMMQAPSQRARIEAEAARLIYQALGP